ncbi:MAG TPA: DUF2203 domain-containing protein [Candidatus Limnocylindria bacterium]|nr:DUF2203 domain-containing protein [Candidatus Limnocylindria bacterium]
MRSRRSYSPDEARELLPLVRSTILQLATLRRRPGVSADELRALLGFLDSHDVVVRDIEAGLVDFPTLRDGEPAWLCWRLEDPDLAYWHTTREGFASRRPL